MRGSALWLGREEGFQRRPVRGSKGRCDREGGYERNEWGATKIGWQERMEVGEDWAGGGTSALRNLRYQAVVDRLLQLTPPLTHSLAHPSPLPICPTCQLTS